MTRVSLEQGRTWTFACAVDWPGWARRGKGDEAALEQLAAYTDRYAAAVQGFSYDGQLHVIARVPGTATTDSGAPDARGPWDDEPLTEGEPARLAAVLRDCWAALDRAVAGASAELRKGPRGGGRDRDAVAAHVQESERAYSRTIGVRLPPRTPWDEQRDAVAAAVEDGAAGTRWPLRYFVSRSAWHVLDHAWEIEDKDLT